MTHHVHGHEMKPASQMSRLGEVQNEYDHDRGHGAYRCCGPRNGPVDRIRHRQKFFFTLILSVPIILYLPLGKFIFGFQPPAPP